MWERDDGLTVRVAAKSLMHKGQLQVKNSVLIG